MEKNIAVIWGDCSSPEIVKQTLRVLDKVAEKYGHTFHYTWHRAAMTERVPHRLRRSGWGYFWMAFIRPPAEMIFWIKGGKGSA